MRGFVTLAVGDANYYKIAENLLNSYRLGGGGLPFAIVADKENDITQKFDKTVVISNPKYSFEDKLKCFQASPFYETIFIDADCLVYGNVDVLWEQFDRMQDDFCCYGRTYNLQENNTNSWFQCDGIGEYAKKINFLVDIHGGLYFFRKSKRLDVLCELINELREKYSTFKFRMFTGVPADEPIVALAMALMNIRPKEFDYSKIVFLPWLDYCKLDPFNGSFVFSSNKLDIKNARGILLHWGHSNTYGQEYLYNADIFRARCRRGLLKVFWSILVSQVNKLRRKTIGHFNGILQRFKQI